MAPRILAASATVICCIALIALVHYKLQLPLNSMPLAEYNAIAQGSIERIWLTAKWAGITACALMGMSLMRDLYVGSKLGCQQTEKECSNTIKPICIAPTLLVTAYTAGVVKSVT